MKHLYKIGFCLASVFLTTACDYEPLEFEAEKPPSIVLQEEIDAYDDLKAYIAREANPGFKLGAGMVWTDYSQKGVLYRLVNRNFDEVTFGNALKHGAIVQADGSLNQATLENLKETTGKAGISVFGHTLATHSNQNAAYLKSLIAPTIIPATGNGGTSGTDVVANFETDELGKTYAMTNGGSGTVVNDPTGESGKVLNVKGVQSHPQFTVTLPNGRTLGNYLSLTLDFYGTGSTGLYGQGMRMSIDGGALVGFNSPSAYGSPDGGWGRGKIVMQLATLNLTEAQKKLTSFTVAVGSGTGSANYYIDNVTMQWKLTDIIVEKTAEEKKTIINDAFQRWISGMVTASKGFVKAWDVVSEPMDDEKPSEVRTGTGKTVASDEFYWQDYLGKEYAVTAFKTARANANATDLLFINDTKLEQNLDKTRGLIEYMKYIEANGGKIDGIGARLNLTLTSDKQNISTMFQLLAATGKMVRISGLSVSPGVTADKVTPEQYMAQKEMFQYVLDEYVKTVPAKQRYGVTISSPVDATEPSGLWTQGLIRKPAYSGFAEGLKGLK
ncbi:endo-1,4-beta-xylanase [Rufibacter latericius]|uniref:endo-1,4-beta-xylanase n=1 Tax=Rufibacter latericius TaxID=2487040 RepID=A0A3M9MMQ5_9BACT|nr:endo-1,4-beta-xylanase [Rufibacter latericius]RNI26830.1 glycoside hydrolase [Rufibacter latericius]